MLNICHVPGPRCIQLTDGIISPDIHSVFDSNSKITRLSSQSRKTMTIAFIVLLH